MLKEKMMTSITVQRSITSEMIKSQDSPMKSNVPRSDNKQQALAKAA